MTMQEMFTEQERDLIREALYYYEIGFMYVSTKGIAKENEI